VEAIKVYSFKRIRIKKGDKTFEFKSGLPNPEDYGIYALPNWDTTVFLIAKTNKGFKLGFGKPCPNDNGWLDLNIHTPKRMNIILRQGKASSSKEEPKRKYPPQTNWL
jgi:hypothetical protein